MRETLPDTWRRWLLHNRDRGCDVDALVKEATSTGGCDRDAVLSALRLTDSALPSWQSWYDAPLTLPNHKPKAWRLDTDLAQVYELPSLLSKEECKEVIDAINKRLNPSVVTVGSSDYRTSRTSYLRETDPELAKRLDLRFSSLMGAHPRFSEPIQGQRYDRGQYFKEHTDWFTPGTEEYRTNTEPGGQRTWTVMVYLNSVEKGGETLFRHLDRSFTPSPGMGLVWNNLRADGSPNPFTLHEAMPVEEGTKWVITKWFRSEPGRNETRH